MDSVVFLRLGLASERRIPTRVLLVLGRVLFVINAVVFEAVASVYCLLISLARMLVKEPIEVTAAPILVASRALRRQGLALTSLLLERILFKSNLLLLVRLVARAIVLILIS